jgi:pimeloyl-ACP methyl ester carboxylesterase
MIKPLQIPARGLVLDALAAGPRAGELVVLLHGFPQACTRWTSLLATLAAAGYRAVAPDQRGYSPGARPTTIQAYRLPRLVAGVCWCHPSRPGTQVPLHLPAAGGPRGGYHPKGRVDG